ncbi:MAG: hypothetical protein QNJ63_29790 [Calothrix sp. MO_192.B10]|nr:hypothetical protein [Calothrix sp. MO_192.B10]
MFNFKVWFFDLVEDFDILPHFDKKPGIIPRLVNNYQKFKDRNIACINL